ncbi:hypothetical protein EMWEY_00053330 [Eimeria maxima]|uniref:Uncharacterized protein n=1 Tax=Eimeria maxima TaxID=5804 RepID=U6M8J8_EIMMA|nr:hypothetical protein EMWEY_00053330 [Eimeria maxima]CDJ58799.1 hypothetical protein EMWEY_00053330 [Eimeria maxima]
MEQPELQGPQGPPEDEARGPPEAPEAPAGPHGAPYRVQGPPKEVTPPQREGPPRQHRLQQLKLLTRAHRVPGDTQKDQRPLGAPVGAPMGPPRLPVRTTRSQSLRVQRIAAMLMGQKEDSMGPLNKLKNEIKRGIHPRGPPRPPRGPLGSQGGVTEAGKGDPDASVGEGPPRGPPPGGPAGGPPRGPRSSLSTNKNKEEKNNKKEKRHFGVFNKHKNFGVVPKYVKAIRAAAAAAAAAGEAAKQDSAAAAADVCLLPEEERQRLLSILHQQKEKAETRRI